MSDEECESCGREDGHHLGCPEVAKPVKPNIVQLEDTGPSLSPHGESDQCAFGDCKNPKRPKGKGPAPKYCTEHSDPKNRK